MEFLNSTVRLNEKLSTSMEKEGLLLSINSEDIIPIFNISNENIDNYDIPEISSSISTFDNIENRPINPMSNIIWTEEKKEYWNR